MVVVKRLLMIAALAVAACTSPPTPRPTPLETQMQTAAPPAFASVAVTAVGTIRRGGSSADTLVLTCQEASVGSIGRGPGSFEVSLSDQAGSPSTVSFIGSPSTAGSPGSLGATATIYGNTLVVTILDSDQRNVEPIIVTGIGIAASPSAALGPIQVTVGSFAGSLAGGAAHAILQSPGSVVDGP
jgi:hypothetical protein